MCRPPKPIARSQASQLTGANNAAVPRTMKHIPITGTTRIENAPPVTTPAP